MADDQALQGQLPHLANGGCGRSQLLPYQPHGFTEGDRFPQISLQIFVDSSRELAGNKAFG